MEIEDFEIVYIFENGKYFAYLPFSDIKTIVTDNVTEHELKQKLLKIEHEKVLHEFITNHPKAKTGFYWHNVGYYSYKFFYDSDAYNIFKLKRYDERNAIDGIGKCFEKYRNGHCLEKRNNDRSYKILQRTKDSSISRLANSKSSYRRIHDKPVFCNRNNGRRNPNVTKSTIKYYLLNVMKRHLEKL